MSGKHSLPRFTAALGFAALATAMVTTTPEAHVFSSPRIGDRIRVAGPQITRTVSPEFLRNARRSAWFSYPVVDGRLVGSEKGTIVLSPEASDTTLTIQANQVQTLEVWRKGNRGRGGLAVGVLGGALIGGIIGSLVDKPVDKPSESPPDSEPLCEEDEPLCGLSDFEVELFEIPDIPTWASGAICGAILGGISGVLIGRSIEADRWDQLDLRRLKVALGSADSRDLQLSCSLRF